MHDLEILKHRIIFSTIAIIFNFPDVSISAPWIQSPPVRKAILSTYIK